MSRKCCSSNPLQPGSSGQWGCANPGLRAHLAAGRTPPDHQLEASMRVANPAQSLHALTVGSVSGAVFEDATPVPLPPVNLNRLVLAGPVTASLGRS